MLAFLGCNTQQQEEDKRKAILQAQKDSIDLAVKKEIKSDLKKAYYNLVRIKDVDQTGVPFYNNDIGSTMAFTMFPMFAMDNKAEFIPVNLVVTNIKEDSAYIAYDLNIMADGQLKNQISVSMLTIKIGSDWKFDADKFIPKKEKGDVKASLN